MEKPQQQELLEPSSDIFESLRILVMKLGGAGKVGKKMRPELDHEQASTWLNNCLNRDRREKLDLDQFNLLVSMGRSADVHVVMECLGFRHSYEIKPIYPEDEKTRQQREFVDSVNRLEQLAKQIHQMVPPERRSK